MYEIRLADGSPIYYQGDADYTAYNIECYTAKGDAGYVKFTLPKSNPAHGTLSTRSSIVKMLLDGESLGFYEVREITHGIEYDEQVYAVGELAWLYDSVQPQAEFHDVTPRGFLAALLNVHNSQCPDHQFSVGIVDVTDPNDSLYRFTNRETTLDDIREKLVDRLGGQIKLRRANGVRYIDYLTDATYGTECTQRIYFGENLMDYSDTMTAADVCSAVVPLGCRLENDAGDNSTIGNLEKRLTIEGVNGGADWISSPQLVERFGNVRTVKVWDDVTVPQNLLSKAQKWLASDQFERMHLTVRAVDLSLTSTQFERFRCGDSAVVAAVPYGLERRFPITVRTYHPDSPESDTIELGDAVAVSYVATQNALNKAFASTEQESTYRQTQWLTEAIENVTAMMVGSRGGYKYTEYDQEGRWLADYILDSDDLETAQIVRKVNLNGTAYSTNGYQGPYETAIMANGIILGKYIQAHSVTAEKISQDYTAMWEDADTQTLNTARTEFKAADAQISAKVSQVEETATGIRTDLQAEIKVRADQISQTVKRGQINSTIAQTAETIYIESNKFGWNSSNSSMTTSGTLTAKNATFTNCTIDGLFSCDSSNTRVRINGGYINFFGRKSEGAAWQQGTRMYSTLASDGSPMLNINTTLSGYTSDINMWSRYIILESYNGGAKSYTGGYLSDLRIANNTIVLSSRNGQSGTNARNTNLSLDQGNIKIDLAQGGIIDTWIRVSHDKVEIKGHLYVNGTLIA